MKIVLIEDEGIALRKMKKVIAEISPEVEFIAELESIQEAREWFSRNDKNEIDLIFSDIQLSDGLSFEIFEEINTPLPIIFTTAYDEYALRAFRVNGIDYLLKPIQKKDLALSITNFETKKKHYSKSQITDIQQLIKQFQQPKKQNPNFLSYQKDKLIPVPADSIAFFYTSNQVVYAYTEQQRFILEDSLEDVEKRLPQERFFRANRQFIIQKRYVANAVLYFNNRLMLNLHINLPEQIIISREKANAFKIWLSEG
jgi:two-component system LytT family response regulator